MIRRRNALFATTVLALAFGCSFETPPSVEPIADLPTDSRAKKPTAKEQVDRAMELGKDNPEKAMIILESVLKTSPENREALLLMSVLSVVQGEIAPKPADRIALFHKSFAAFTRIKEIYKDLNPGEKSFQPRIEFGEARALALEGKAGAAFGILKPMMASGNEDFDSADTLEDLKPLLSLPEFNAFIESSYTPKLEQAQKEVATELNVFKSFPFDFQLKGLDDTKVSLADYRGKVTIVDFWGTWCPPCRREIPHFVALLKKYKDQGLEIVGINCNEEGTEDVVKKTITDFAKAYQIGYKCLLNDDTAQLKIPGFSAYPTTLLIDRAGKVRLEYVGMTSKAKLEAAIQALLAEGSKSP